MEVGSSATIVDSNMYFGETVNGRDYLCAVDLNSEKGKWRMPLPGSVTSPIDVVVDNGLFLYSEKILCFTALSPATRVFITVSKLDQYRKQFTQRSLFLVYF